MLTNEQLWAKCKSGIEITYEDLGLDQSEEYRLVEAPDSTVGLFIIGLGVVSLFVLGWLISLLP